MTAVAPPGEEMLAALSRPAAPPTLALATCDVEIVVPVFNEQADLERSVRRLYDFVNTDFPFSAVVTIADNASTDSTWSIACLLAAELDGVNAVHLDEKGRGRALRRVWTHSSARVVAYMDVDLSTDLAALLPLVAPLISGHSEVAIGTRLSRGSRVVRGPKREIISRGYNALLHTTLRTGFSDAQCGFKALRAECARALLPHVQDTAWFFDTELLVLAERSGMRISEIPVDWTDDPDSRVHIRSTVCDDLRGIFRVSRAMARGDIPMHDLRTAFTRGATVAVPGVPTGLVRQFLRFASIGVVSTLAYLAVYLGLRTDVTPQVANLLALAITAIGNTAANRRFTFGIRGAGATRHQVQGMLVFAVGLLLTSGTLALLAHLAPHAGRTTELCGLIAANVAATAARFVLLRRFVFRRPAVPLPAIGT